MSVKAQRSVLTRGSQNLLVHLVVWMKQHPPTSRQVIQFSYFLKNSYPHLNSEISMLIAKELISIRQAVNPQLPLSGERYIGQKVNIFCYKRAKQIDRKSLAATKVKRMKELLERLFDIFSCSCKLPVLRCDDFAVQLSKRHIVCTCPPNKEVPLQELPFEAIFKLIDGTTKSLKTFTGPLRKLCINNYQDLP